MKRFVLLFIFLILFNTFLVNSQESMYSRPGIGINLVVGTVQMNISLKNISNLNFSDKSKYTIVELFGDQFYADMTKSDEVIICYDAYQNIRYIQADVTRRITELIYGMAIVGYIYREFDDYYFFPNVISVNGFDINIRIFKDGIIQYEIDYD